MHSGWLAPTCILPRILSRAMTEMLAGEMHLLLSLLLNIHVAGKGKEVSITKSREGLSMVVHAPSTQQTKAGVSPRV